MDYYDLAFPKNASAADAVNNDTPPAAGSANNPYTTPADRAKFDSLSPADQAWLTKGGGKPDINDPFILARSPNKGKPATAIVNSLSPEEQAKLDQAQNSSSEPVIDPAGSNKKESDPESGAKKTSTDLGAASVAGGSAPQTAGTFITTLQNPLHAYPSYTYNLSLHLMTDADYIEMMETEQYVAKRVLIASAGRYNDSAGSNQFIRAPRFQEDFYFDSLNLETLIQPTERNRNTNALSCDFTIIEPYGFTLIERLLKTSQDIGSKNYLDMPYLLQIDFFAMNNAGEVTGLLSDLTKRIPLKLTGMETSVTARGSEYRIHTNIYGHQAFSEIYGSSQASFEMTGSKVGSFFQSDSLSDSATRMLQRIATGQNIKNVAQNGSISGGRPPGADDHVRVTSYAAAINGWQQALKNANKIEYPDVYKFEFDPEIAESDFVVDNLINHQATAFTPRNDAQQVSNQYLSNAGQVKDMLDQKRQTFAINAGTAVDRVIDYIVRNSTYILKQLVIPEDGDKDGVKYQTRVKENNGPLRWWKIVPRIRILEFDSRRNVYRKEITYYVKKYLMKNLPLDFAPRGVEQYPIKKYDYIYTGQNTDIIDFDLKFNMNYYTAATAYRDSVEDVAPVPDASQGNKSKNVADYQGCDANWEANVVLDGNSIAPLQHHPRVADTRARATGSVVTAQQVAAADVEGYILSKVQGDMIGVKLKIIGDPHYIKQDDIFYRPMYASDTSAVDLTGDPRLTPNGSIRTDDGTVYVNLNFRTPMDINEPDGLIKFRDENLTQSAFSGLYRLLSVTNHFQGGQFTQELDLIRAPRQDEDAINAAQISSDQRSESTTVAPKNIDNVQGPGSAVPQRPDADEGTRPNQNAPDGQPPGPDIPPAADQKDLSEVNATAEEKPITQQTEPVAAPANPTTEDELMKSIIDGWPQTHNTRLPKAQRLALNEAELAKWTKLQNLYESQGKTDRAEIARNAANNIRDLINLIKNG